MTFRWGLELPCHFSKYKSNSETAQAAFKNYIHISTLCMYTIYIYICTYIPIYIYTRIYTYNCVYIHVHTCVHAIYIYIFMYMYTCTWLFVRLQGIVLLSVYMFAVSWLQGIILLMFCQTKLKMFKTFTVTTNMS